MSHISKILVVEDNPLLLLDLCDQLAERGYAPIPATTANAAARLLDGKVDALITDIELGAGPDGLALARLAARLRPGFPIVVVSGGVTPSASDLPPNATFLPKPSNIQKLVGALHHSARAKAA